MPKLRRGTGHLAAAEYQLKRSILESSLKRTLTDEDWKISLAFFDGVCAFCGAPATRKDHLIPVVERGDFVLGNVVPACQPCDDSKGRNEYSPWMHSVRFQQRTGLTGAVIQRRLAKIDSFARQHGYKPRTDGELFGDALPRYREILEEMKALVTRARKLVEEVSPTKERTGGLTKRPAKTPGRQADQIRAVIISEYFNPARERGESTVTIRAGDIHSKMGLRNRHANVCQVLAGEPLQVASEAKLVDRSGPPAGGNSHFTYELSGR